MFQMVLLEEATTDRGVRASRVELEWVSGLACVLTTASIVEYWALVSYEFRFVIGTFCISLASGGFALRCSNSNV